MQKIGLLVEVGTNKGYCRFDVGLIKELNVRFPKHMILNAMGMVYPQYWL